MLPYDDTIEKPLFGDRRPRDRVVNLIVGAFTSISVAVTLISAFLFPPGPPNGVNVFFAVIMVLICGSLLTLIFWYRLGDIEPKFRTMIYFNAFTIILLCVCGNLYIHQIGIKICPNNSTLTALAGKLKPPL